MAAGEAEDGGWGGEGVAREAAMAPAAGAARAESLGLRAAGLRRGETPPPAKIHCCPPPAVRFPAPRATATPPPPPTVGRRLLATSSGICRFWRAKLGSSGAPAPSTPPPPPPPTPVPPPPTPGGGGGGG